MTEYSVSFVDSEEIDGSPQTVWKFETRERAEKFVQDFYNEWKNLDEHFLKYESCIDGFELHISKITITDDLTNKEMFNNWFNDFYND